MAIVLKHAKEAAAEEDGERVLVDRRLPRGRREASLALRVWLPALGPSAELKAWYARRPAQWLLFRKRYLAELGDELALAALLELESLASDIRCLTLVTAAADLEHSHAAVLRDLLSGVRKPPATSGPARAAAATGRARARRSR